MCHVYAINRVTVPVSNTFFPPLDGRLSSSQRIDRDQRKAAIAASRQLPAVAGDQYSAFVTCSGSYYAAYYVTYLARMLHMDRVRSKKCSETEPKQRWTDSVQ